MAECEIRAERYSDPEARAQEVLVVGHINPRLVTLSLFRKDRSKEQGPGQTPPTPPHCWYLPNPVIYWAIMIAGRAGCGKSMQCRNLALAYQAITGNPVVYITTKRQQNVTLVRHFDGMIGVLPGKLDVETRLVTSANLGELTSEMKDEKFADVMVIFDDCRGAPSLMNAITALANEVICMKRESKVVVIYTAHMLINPRHNIIRRATQLTCTFPKSSDYRQFCSFLKMRQVGNLNRDRILTRVQGVRTPCYFTNISPDLFISNQNMGAIHGYGQADDLGDEEVQQIIYPTDDVGVVGAPSTTPKTSLISALDARRMRAAIKGVPGSGVASGEFRPEIESTSSPLSDSAGEEEGGDFSGAAGGGVAPVSRPRKRKRSMPAGFWGAAMRAAGA